MNRKFYVTAVDTFMSGWGRANDKKNIMIFECDNRKECMTLMDNMRNRYDMAEIKYHGSLKPTYDEDQYFISEKNKESYPNWYKKGYIK